MKTAIQQSIEKIKYFQDSTENFAEKRAYAIAMDVLEDHKKTEKEQIIKTAQDNFYIGQDLANDHEVDIKSAEQYFNKTFKSE